MKRTIALLLAVSLASVGFAQPERANVRAQVADVFRKWDAAFANKDVNSLMGMTVKEYSIVDLDGKVMYKAAVRNALSGYFNTFKGKVTSKTRIWNVQLQSRDTVVWAETTVNVGSDGDRPASAMKERFAHTMRWSGGKWHIVQSQALPVDEPWTFKTNG